MGFDLYFHQKLVTNFSTCEGFPFSFTKKSFLKKFSFSCEAVGFASFCKEMFTQVVLGLKIIDFDQFCIKFIDNVVLYVFGNPGNSADFSAPSPKLHRQNTFFVHVCT
jgi:hypothetical protein